MNLKLALLGIVGFIILIALVILNPVSQIDAGSRGVVLQWGAFQNKVLLPGLNFRMPIAEDIIEIDVRTQALRKEGMLTYTADGQTVTVQGVLNFNVDPQFVGTLYKEIGLEYVSKIIVPQVEEATKSVVAKYVALDIPKNRGKISDEIQGILAEKLGKSYIVVTDYIFENEDFDDSYEAAIREKQVQEQNALKEKNITAQEEEKKKQQVLQAEALSETTRLQAAALNTSGGEKAIEKIKAEALLELAKKWDGELPANSVYGSSVLDQVLNKFK